MGSPRKWDERWEELTKVGQGGQGTAYLVRDLLNPSAEPCVLKALTRFEDPERRGRMRREVVSLETLDHQGVPRLIASNSDRFKDRKVPLYLVVEHIQGVTLETHIVQNGPLSLEAALGFIRALLEVVQYCHAQGVIHRDIKPDNIVLRDARTDSPVLLDLGLSFNADDDESLATASGQQLGNRFLHLPELQLSGPARRDGRSDVTQAIGVFLYCLTGSRPVTLSDHLGNKPHQQQAVRDALGGQSERSLTRLRRLFDRAFELQIDRRLQTTEEALEVFDALLGDRDNAPRDDDESAVLQRIKSLTTASAGYQTAKEVLARFREVDHRIRVVRRQLLSDLGEDFQEWGHDLHYDESALTYRDVLGFGFLVSPSRKLELLFRGTVSGSEVIVEAGVANRYAPFGTLLPGTDAEVGRVPIVGAANWAEFDVRVRRIFMAALDNEVANPQKAK